MLNTLLEGSKFISNTAVLGNLWQNQELNLDS